MRILSLFCGCGGLDMGFVKAGYNIVYFAACGIANAYVLGKTKKYDTPLYLTDVGVTQAPQSFVYIDETTLDNI